MEHEIDAADVVFWGLVMVDRVEPVVDGPAVMVAIQGSLVLAKLSVVGNWSFPLRVGQVKAVLVVARGCNRASPSKGDGGGCASG